MRASPEIDPVALPTPPRRPDKPEPRIVKFLLRIGPEAKRICEEAAEREGLSLNAWAYRVLVEHAKRSRDGWRSIPINDDPSTQPVPAPNAPYQPITFPPYTSPPNIWPSTSPPYTSPSTSPFISHTGETSGSSAQGTRVELNGIDISNNVASATFTIPDIDIPDFG